MNVANLSGPGVDKFVRGHLADWRIEALTDIQSKAVQAGIAAGNNMIVSAPTSSGKTLIGEIAILSALRSGVRAIYLVSHKALADQKYVDFVSRFGEGAADPLASVGLDTGDRSEGEIDAQLVVATYEKAFGLILTGQLRQENALVVADELQILGDSTRGPEIETLCAVFRQRGLKQFVALTATVENAADLAGWMRCDLVSSSHRDVPLHQEIWYEDSVYRTTFGHEEGTEIHDRAASSTEVMSVVGRLLELRCGPVLVFTESRGEAMRYADAFGKSRPRASEGLVLADQLDLFSEPNESSEQLRENAERRVAFHTADLSPQERQVLESGFSGSRFDVCFATTTLAAGVNFPFRSIVFPKLTFQFGDRKGSHLVRSDYRNMSGRAGRLGMHEDGFAILLPQDKVELAHANRLVLPDNDQLDSQFVNLSVRKSILGLIAARLASNFAEVIIFFENTLYWYQALERNPKKLETVRTESSAAITWLVSNGLLRDSDGTLLITPLGQATALSGLLPATAVQLADMLRRFGQKISASFEEWIPGLIYAVCESAEFRAEKPSRFLPYPTQQRYEAVAFWSAQRLPVELDQTDIKLAQCAQGITLYVAGMAERKIAHATGVSSGSVRRLSGDVAWVLDGLHKLSSVPDLDCPQTLSNQIAMLARRVRWGAPAEVLDVMRVAERHSVPGFGRQRAMALLANGIKTIHDVLATANDRLATLLGNSAPRAKALLSAASHVAGLGPNRLQLTHRRLAECLGIGKLVEACDKALGCEYEAAITALLRVETTWVVTVVDDGVRQNVPDMLIELGGLQALIECKTCTKSPSLIKKEEAWAVIQKAADFDTAMRRVTLGKPAFDETSKGKAAASNDIALVEHHVFMEGLLRVHAGTLSPQEFLAWLTTPGVAEIERLSGTPSFAIS